MSGSDNINDASERSLQNTSNGSTPTSEPYYMPYMYNHMPNYNSNYRFHLNGIDERNNQSHRIWNPAFDNTTNIINAQYQNNRTNQYINEPSLTNNGNYHHHHHHHQHHNQHLENQRELTEAERSSINAIARNFVPEYPYQSNNQFSAREQLAYYARRIFDRDNYYHQQQTESETTDNSSESDDESSDISSSTSSKYQDRSDYSEDIDR